MIPTVIIRHPKERLSKCSLEPLRGHEQIEFLKAAASLEFNADNYILLAVDAPELSIADAGHPLLLLDSTWKLLPALQRCVRGKPIYRSLPSGIVTAYPRVSKLTPDPECGLASVEALYLAQKILGHDMPELLSDYHWRDAFLAHVQVTLS